MGESSKSGPHLRSPSTRGPRPVGVHGESDLFPGRAPGDGYVPADAHGRQGPPPVRDLTNNGNPLTDGPEAPAGNRRGAEQPPQRAVSNEYVPMDRVRQPVAEPGQGARYGTVPTRQFRPQRSQNRAWTPDAAGQNRRPRQSPPEQPFRPYENVNPDRGRIGAPALLPEREIQERSGPPAGKHANGRPRQDPDRGRSTHRQHPSSPSANAGGTASYANVGCATGIKAI
ncbi:hypothetical protein CDD83_5340 [Cordyceps sp. RAO-2017]|nr:hypothetical protein CDD83_5340 [Cordyceps sp. RAO-2017]